MKIFTRTAVLSFGFAVAIGTAAEAQPLSTDRDMVTGVSATEADCRASPINRLWVSVENRGFCVRYWFSTVGGSKDEALVAFNGDIGGKIDGKLQLLEQSRAVSDASLQKAADYGSRLYRGPYFLIARPGTFGSSGHHLKDRKTLLEIRVATAALNALKQHNGFKRFHLVGQSGGGHTVAGLVQLRSDIGCAVIASGAISLRSMASDRVGRPLVGEHRFYDPIDHVHAMKQRPDLRLFVVSDRKDKFVSYRSQLEFVERVKAHNLPITHITATATDKDSHGLFAHGHRLAVDCAKKARDQVPVASPAVASARSAQAVAPLISPPPPTSLANEPKKVTTLTVRQENASAGSTGHGTAVPSLMPPATSSGVLAPSLYPATSSPLQVVPRAAQPAALPPGGDYVVQVSAQKTEDEARASYRALQQKYPSVFGGREANIRHADLGGKGVFYWAQIGPFATADQANAFCNSLKDAGGECIVQENASAESTGHGTAVPSLMPPGGSAKELPPVDILYVASGPCNRNENNKLNCRIGKDVNRGVDDRYGWAIGFRTNRKTVHFVEEIEVSAPTTWPEPRPGFTVSNDKRSARFEGEVDGSQGYLSHIWVLLSDDPDGSIKIKVTIENKLVRNFELLVKSP